MKAVNLIPSDSRRSFTAMPGQSSASIYGVIAVLAIALVFVTLDVVTSHTISQRKSKLATLTTQANNESALAARLAPYVQYAQKAQAQESTVRTIASARFDWATALTDLSRVVPANTTVATINASVASGAASGSSGLRADIDNPAFELTGCSDTQDDVASLMSRLRTMPKVIRVSLSSSTEAAAGASTGVANSSNSGCKGNAPAFDLVVFFGAMPNAGADGVVAATPTTTTSTTTPATASTTTSSAGTSTPGTTTAPATTQAATTQGSAS